MLVYIAAFAGLLSAVVLLGVYAADRYEREPIALIQNAFLLGALGQLVLVLAVAALAGQPHWSGPWLALSVLCATLFLPFHLAGMAEADERFDGIVYGVALLTGATCVIHLNNLPRIAAASPFRDALAADAAPDLRDLLILVGSPELGADLGQGLVVIAVAVLVGATVGALHVAGWRPLATAGVGAAVGAAALALDLLASGSWPARAALVVAALAVAAAVKRRSVFRDRPQPTEPEAMALAVKTLLMVLGAALVTAVLLQALVDPRSSVPEVSSEPSSRPAIPSDGAQPGSLR